MTSFSFRTARERWLRLALVLVPAVFFGTPARGDDTTRRRGANQDRAWRNTVESVKRGDFTDAAEQMRGVTGGGRLAAQVRTWLEEYETADALRHEMDKVEFDKYVGYAKARIEREEYDWALGWVIRAADVAADRDDFVKSVLVRELVDTALTEAGKHRKAGEWRDSWSLYARLTTLDETEPRYQKLEEQLSVHLRLELVFQENGKWEERIEQVRWNDAKAALEEVETRYVKPVDFKKIAESGLDHLLLLAESKAVRDVVEGLADDIEREAFEARLRRRLDNVRAADHLSAREVISIFHRAIRTDNRQTVNMPEELIVSELMRGAFEPLDDFTTIIWPKEVAEFDKHTSGDFVGVGISIIKRGGEIVVVTPLEDAPAYYKGVLPGDIITHVDGKSLEGFSLTKTVDTITGAKGTPVTLTLRRQDKSIEMELIRSTIKIQSIKGVARKEDDPQRWDHWLDKDNGIGYVRITGFQGNTVEDLGNTLTELQHSGMKGLVLDLRDNPGGLLESAFRVATLFLDAGDDVVSTKGRIALENQQFTTPFPGPFTDIPLVVLANEGSASGSEIVAGAIRDNKRGTVIGDRTFGKFSVQHLVQLSKSSSAKLKITTAKYYLPSGDSLHRGHGERGGIAPDISVKLGSHERVKIWKMRRDRDRIGPPAPETTAVADAGPAGDDQSEQGFDRTVVPEVDTEGPFFIGPFPNGQPRLIEGDEGPSSPSADDAKSGDDTNPDAAKDAEGGEEDEEDKLPKLEQPDENERPDVDPQLDAALLFMRVVLFGDRFPTLAAAELATAERPKLRRDQ